MRRTILLVVSILTVLALAGCQAAASPTPSAPTTLPATPPAATLAPTTPPTPAGTPTGTWMKLSPDTAAPGTQINIEGYMPGGPTAAEAQKNQALAEANLCWQSCLTGFVEVGQPVQWSATDPGHFTTQFTVPSVPWVSGQDPAPVAPGDYTISIQCLEPQLQGCALKEGAAPATFHLTGPTPNQCTSGQPCAQLSLSPSHGQPGDQIQVTGWAPIAEIIGGNPFGANLVMETPGSSQPSVQIGQITQAADGSLSGSFQVPQSLPGEGALKAGSYTVAIQISTPNTVKVGGSTVLLAPTAFTLTGAMTWASLKTGQPLHIQPATSMVNPTPATLSPASNTIAYCQPGGIQLSIDGGQNWRSISTSEVASLADKAGYSPMANGGPAGKATCLTVTLDAAHPRSLFATFEMADKKAGAPPVYFMGYYSTDEGHSWAAVPAPTSEAARDFGGFWSDGQGLVQALYAAPTSSSGQAALPLIQHTTDGGATWQAGSLTCPASGPCLRFGAAPGAISGMGAPLPQVLYVSSDGGLTWKSTGINVELRLASPSELVSLTDKTVALISGDSPYPLQVSMDGGNIWQTVALPPIPGNESGGATLSGLQMLPNGSLVALSGSQWMALPSGASAWCPVPGASLPASPVLVRAAAGDLWWVSPGGQGIGQAPMSAFACHG